MALGIKQKPKEEIMKDNQDTRAHDNADAEARNRLTK